jgi:hypothetical protein
MAAITAAVIGGAMAIGGSLIQGNQERQAAKGYKREADRKAGEIVAIEKDRQAVPNPYANIKDLSSIAKDLTDQMTNPFVNIGVATQAAKMQVEEADISLANTLDTIRSTGASAGGATALAQAALQSKKGVSASIEQQEVTNERLKAEGNAQLQRDKIAEAQRLQNVQFTEAQRLQTSESEGIRYKFEREEDRTTAQLNRLAGQQTQAQVNMAGAQQNASSALAGGISAVGNVASAYIGSTENTTKLPKPPKTITKT